MFLLWVVVRLGGGSWPGEGQRAGRGRGKGDGRTQVAGCPGQDAVTEAQEASVRCHQEARRDASERGAVDWGPVTHVFESVTVH